MAITKNNYEVRLKSGNNFKVNYAGSWITLGNIVSGKITRQEETGTVTYADGTSVDKRTTSKCMVEIVLAQVSKEIYDTLDAIFAATSKLYYYNGRTSITGGKHMEFYFPEAEGYANFDVEMRGDAHQLLTVQFSVQPQATNASLIPNVDLPSDKHATGAGLVTGTNPYYVVLETTVS